MFRKIATLALLAALFQIGAIRAEEAAGTSIEATIETKAAPADTRAEAAADTAELKQDADSRIQEMLDMPIGVFDIDYDDEGNVVRLKIKGETEVSTALRGERGDRQAREKAQREAKAAFSKFLNEQVCVLEGDAEAYVIKEKNGTESAEYLNTSAKLTTVYSQSCLRGLLVLVDHVAGEGDKRKAVVVMGWSKKLTDASANIQNTIHTAGGAKGSDLLGPSKGGKTAPAVPNANTVTRAAKSNDF